MTNARPCDPRMRPSPLELGSQGDELVAFDRRNPLLDAPIGRPFRSGIPCAKRDFEPPIYLHGSLRTVTGKGGH